MKEEIKKTKKTKTTKSNQNHKSSTHKNSKSYSGGEKKIHARIPAEQIYIGIA